MDTSREELIKLITKMVIDELNHQEILIPIGVSNRHVHVNREDLDTLFGNGYELSKFKDLKQPGQYASNELVTIRGPKGEFKDVRILGPLRKKTQVEISLSDGFKLGIRPPIRESGDLEGAESIEIIGPKGRILKDSSTIAALRHIHMPKETARIQNLKDKDIVNVKIPGIRESILGNVLVRVSDDYVLEMHVDLDEANACNLKNNDIVKIVKKG